jgi:hypothetical protein
MDQAERDLLPLRRFLAQRGWPLEIGTYDMYSGEGMGVSLEPDPSGSQLGELRRTFGSTYTFDVIRGTFT